MIRSDNAIKDITGLRNACKTSERAIAQSETTDIVEMKNKLSQKLNALGKDFETRDLAILKAKLKMAEMNHLGRIETYLDYVSASLKATKKLDANNQTIGKDILATALRNADMNYAVYLWEFFKDLDLKEDTQKIKLNALKRMADLDKKLWTVANQKQKLSWLGKKRWVQSKTFVWIAQKENFREKINDNDNFILWTMEPLSDYEKSLPLNSPSKNLLNKWLFAATPKEIAIIRGRDAVRSMKLRRMRYFQRRGR